MCFPIKVNKKEINLKFKKKLMKNIIFLIVWIVIGYLFGAYTSYRFLVDFSFDSVNKYLQENLDTVHTGDANLSTTSQELLEKQKENIKNMIAKQQETIKENIRQEIKNYINERIDEIFWKSEKK